MRLLRQTNLISRSINGAVQTLRREGGGGGGGGGFTPTERQATCKHMSGHLKGQASCYMALISCDWARRLLKESGGLTGDRDK